MIKLRNFFKSFGPKNVLRSLDLDIDSGEIVTIKGKNGSGKTTLLKALSTLEKPDDYDLAEIKVKGTKKDYVIHFNGNKTSKLLSNPWDSRKTKLLKTKNSKKC